MPASTVTAVVFDSVGEPVIVPHAATVIAPVESTTRSTGAVEVVPLTFVIASVPELKVQVADDAAAAGVPPPTSRTTTESAGATKIASSRRGPAPQSLPNAPKSRLTSIRFGEGI